MGRRKTKLLNHSYWQWRYWSMKREILKHMHRFPADGLRAGKMPPDINAALTLFFLGLDVTDLLLEASSAAQSLRLDLARLMVSYPEFAAAAIYSCFVTKTPARKRKPGSSGSALVREFLLTEDTVILPGGERTSQVGATDDEIGKAIANKYGVTEPSLKTVRGERKRLEKLFPSSVASYVDFYLKVTKELDLMVPNEERRSAEIDAFYEHE